MDELQLGQGFTEAEREHVGELYWDAFGGKLSAAFRDQSAGRLVVTIALSSDRMVVARVASQIVGVCGFYEGDRGAVRISYGLLRRELSRSATVWALVVLSILKRRDRTGALVLDGLCVAETHRGRGIGSRLLDAVTAYAHDTGAHAVQLSFIDSNPRAAALYRRYGFTISGRGQLGPLRHLFGFDGYTTMQKRMTR